MRDASQQYTQQLRSRKVYVDRELSVCQLLTNMVLVRRQGAALKAPWRRCYRRRTRPYEKAPPPLPRLEFVQREVSVYPTESARAPNGACVRHAPRRALYGL